MATPSLFPAATAKIDRARILKIYSGMKARCRARYWKSGKRKGSIRTPEVILPFTGEQLWEHAQRHVGIGIQCPYCKKIGNANFITLADCVFDHIVPRKRGGSWELSNLCPVCAECNNTKGEMSLSTYVMLMVELKNLPPDDGAYIIKCLRTQGHVMTNFRGNAAAANKSAKPDPPKQLMADFDDDF